MDSPHISLQLQPTMRGCALPLTKLALPRITNYPCSLNFSVALIQQWRPPKASITKQFNFKPKASAESSPSASVVAAEAEQEESFQVLSVIKSDYNDIVIVDTPKARMLLLDSSHNVHSILTKEQKWTGSYWDEFASLPAIVPRGPIAILGLGGGTAAHLMLDLWPSLQLEGWEIDQILIDKAREYFGLSDLERMTEDGGVLNVHIGDVFIPSENLQRRYAGIVVDLFSDGKVLPQLEEVSTWLELNDRLMPDGRFMVNCGGIDGGSNPMDASAYPGNLLSHETWLQNPTLKALSKAFPGQLSWKRMPKENGENFMALTGPLPDLQLWSASVPSPLSRNVKDWRPCKI